MSIYPRNIPVIIVAGGKSSRLQTENTTRKWQLAFGKSTLLNYISQRARLNHKDVLVNLPASEQEHPSLCPSQTVLIDSTSDIQGPMAGIYTALKWAYEQGHPWVATLPCDTPFFPEHLFSRLHQALTQKDRRAAISSSLGRNHPICGLWATDLYRGMNSFIESSTKMSMYEWIHYSEALIIDFSATEESDPFFNINTEADYQLAKTKNHHFGEPKTQ